MFPENDAGITPEEQERLEKVVDRMLAQLSEHFDNIQIFVSKNPQGKAQETVSFRKGLGNYFARYGHVRDWLVEMDANTFHAQGKD